MTKISVIGAGSWGTTVASILAQKATTQLWARTAEVANEVNRSHTNSAYLGARSLDTHLTATTDMAEALEGASLVVVAIPSHVLRETLLANAALPVAGVPVLSLSKGLEEVTDARMSEVIAAVWPAHPVGTLTGPNLAEEVFDGQPTASVIAIDDEALGRDLQELFTTERLRIYTNPDVVGCEIAGVV
jgi:glycerol-3-phosphate dehydrogenase (NAD(P)+)